MDPFKYEIELKQQKAGRPRKGALPWLYPWQYGRELYSEDNFYEMINSYKNWVYIASSRNATTVANVPLRLYVAKNNKGQKLKGYETKNVDKKTESYIRESSALNSLPVVRKAVEFQELLEHPFIDLLKNVNNFYNAFDLIEITQLFQELCGNSYWHILEDRLGVPREIWVIPTTDCKIIPHPTKFISGYEYQKGTEKIPLSERSVIHFKFPSPKSQYYGYAPYSAIKNEYGLYDSINKYEEAVFRNGGGNLSGVYETDQALGDHEFERLKAEIQQTYSGIDAAGKSPLLDNGLKYKPISSSPKEMAHLKGRDVVRESILNAYGLALGMFSKEATRANADAAVYLYMKTAIQPRLIRFAQKLNEKLIWRYDEKLFLQFDNPVPEDQELSLNERIKHVQTGLTSINEERAAMGKEKFDERFDEPILPVNYTNMDGLLANIINGTGEGNIVSDPKQMKELLER